MWMLLAGVIALIGLTVYFYRLRRDDRWKAKPLLSRRQRKREPFQTPPEGTLYSFAARPSRKTIERLGYEKAPDIHLRVKRKRWWDRLFSALGISVACRSDNPKFDRTLHLVTDAAPVCRAMQTSPKTQALMLRLADSCEPNGVRFRQFVVRRGQLWIEVVAKKRKKGSPPMVLADTFVPDLRELSEAMEQEIPETARGVEDQVNKKAALIGSICVALFLGGFLFFSRQILFPIPAPLEIWPLVEMAFVTAIAVFAALVVFTFAWMGRTTRTHVVLIEVVLTGILGAGLTSYSVLREANMAFDSSSGERHVVEVLKKEISHGHRSTSYYLHLAPWHESQGDTQLEVGTSLFNAVRSGYPLLVEEHPGALGVSWVRLIPPRFRYVDESGNPVSENTTP
ncbi:hypothetical protein SR882_07050 [Guyparkeria halophila]|uniref:DUF3592 domain-containing protein n=1 Tax=Guyparkeria halophila TaxID=47960 RepID=A0ABZ0YWE2_9GAMM|nr:hypothetical protein [Guyparkeria halophila]WQH15521.1 hypothetical protein SR882_07050 [Guyparkeria halophila]